MVVEETNKLVVVKKEQPKEEDSIMSMMGGGLGEVIMSDIIPKLKPMFKPVAEKLKEFLGDDRHIIIMRVIKGEPHIIVIDKSLTDYTVSGSSIDKAKNKIDIENQNGIVGVYSILEGLDVMLGGLG